MIKLLIKNLEESCYSLDSTKFHWAQVRTNRSAHDSRINIIRSSSGKLLKEGTSFAHLTAMKSNLAADSKIASLLHRLECLAIESLMEEDWGASVLVTSSSLTSARDSFSSSGD